MKTDSSRRAAQGVLVLLFSGGLLFTCGCATKSHTAMNPARRPSPPATTADEVMQRQAVKIRTRELLQSGRYENVADARKAALKENPPVFNSDQGAQEAAYDQWKQQLRVQEKFEADLDKMKRKS